MTNTPPPPPNDSDMQPVGSKINPHDEYNRYDQHGTIYAATLYTGLPDDLDV